MPVGYVLDEHFRGHLWQAVSSHNSHGSNPLDVTRVGDPPDLPLGTKDPDLLLWAEKWGRILVSRDRATMRTHLANHLHSGRTSPGLFLIRKRVTLRQIVDFLVAAAYASDPDDWQDRFHYIP